jgi:DNA-binding MarR family transcriptional regulator
LDQDSPKPKVIDLNPQVLSVLRLYSTMQADLAHAIRELWRDKGLSERALYIMGLIDLGCNRPAMLIDYFDVKASTMTFEVNKLVESGFVSREIFAKDRRSVLLSLTAKGKKTHKKMTTLINAFMTPRVAALKPGELETFIEIGYKIAQREHVVDSIGSVVAKSQSKRTPRTV